MSEKITALFVGGPKDRQMMDVEKRPYLRLGVAPKNPAVFADAPATFETVEYRLHRFAGGTRDFWVYAVHSMSGDDVMAVLFGQYANPAINLIR